MSEPSGLRGNVVVEFELTDERVPLLKPGFSPRKTPTVFGQSLCTSRLVGIIGGGDDGAFAPGAPGAPGALGAFGAPGPAATGSLAPTGSLPVAPPCCGGGITKQPDAVTASAASNESFIAITSVERTRPARGPFPAQRRSVTLKRMRSSVLRRSGTNEPALAALGNTPFGPVIPPGPLKRGWFAIRCEYSRRATIHGLGQ